MSFSFVKGKAYYANPTLQGAKQVIVACTGRSGHTATFTRVNILKRVEVVGIDGRETARIKADDGHDYFVSAAAEVDLDNAAKVLAALG